MTSTLLKVKTMVFVDGPEYKTLLASSELNVVGIIDLDLNVGDLVAVVGSEGANLQRVAPLVNQVYLPFS